MVPKEEENEYVSTSSTSEQISAASNETLAEPEKDSSEESGDPVIIGESFDDLIPEEFMMDESEILGISLDNISAFGEDDFGDLDFDEETRSSFPEESNNEFLYQDSEFLGNGINLAYGKALF